MTLHLWAHVYSLAEGQCAATLTNLFRYRRQAMLIYRFMPCGIYGGLNMQLSIESGDVSPIVKKNFCKAHSKQSAGEDYVLTLLFLLLELMKLVPGHAGHSTARPDNIWQFWKLPKIIKKYQIIVSSAVLVVLGHFWHFSTIFDNFCHFRKIAKNCLKNVRLTRGPPHNVSTVMKTALGQVLLNRLSGLGWCLRAGDWADRRMLVLHTIYIPPTTPSVPTPDSRHTAQDPSPNLSPSTRCQPQTQTPNQDPDTQPNTQPRHTAQDPRPLYVILQMHIYI